MGSIGDTVNVGGIAGMPWGTILLVFIILLIFGIITVVGVYFLVRYLKYNKKIKIFKKVNGVPQPVGEDKARVYKLNTSGDKVLRLRKHNKALPMPDIQTGNAYWYYISEDGEWFNFGPGDFDENRRELNADFLDKEMRYARTSLDGQRRERYEKESWWQKYGNWVMSLGFLVVIAVFAFLYFKQFADITGSSRKAIEASKEVTKEVGNILSALDNIKGGSGYTSNITQNMFLPFVRGFIG